jgi:predicted nucleic acid-binding protein
MAGKVSKVLFVDTNIWLDFYRSRNDAGVGLLKHLEQVSDRIVVTYQLEAEYKKNRQAAILEGMQDLKPPQQVPRPALFSDAQASALLNRHLKEAEKRVKALKGKLVKALENPASHDPVYQACQRVFHRDSPLVLTRQDPRRRAIRARAFRRFLHGCPPRKKNDTSIGDPFNWEWMIHCAQERNAELVIVSRDSDYGATFENKAYINDHLRQEFSERVSKKRSLLLYTRLSEALKHFSVKVTPAEEKAEAEIVKASPVAKSRAIDVQDAVSWNSFVQTFLRKSFPDELDSGDDDPQADGDG